MEAARVVRAADLHAEITMVSEESDHYFSRTALMWIATGQLSHRETEPLERDAYGKLGLRRVRARATGVDVAAHRVKLAGGLDDVAYDRLLIAAGSRPRMPSWPGLSLAGVGAFVTHQDLAWLVAELGADHPHTVPPRARAHLGASAAGSPYAFREVAAQRHGRPARRPLVVGGGLIGIEAVEVCLALGRPPTFLIRDDTFWPMALSAREARWIGARMAEHGVDVRYDHSVSELLDDGQGCVRAARTDAGDVECDAVLVAIGVSPNTEWLEGSEVARERGAIVVDEGLATDAPDVFAAGDCAGVPRAGRGPGPEPLWYAARAQGRVAGERLLGREAGYAPGPFYNSAKLMDIEYTTCGDLGTGRDESSSWVFEERGSVHSTLRVANEAGRVTGFTALGRRWDHGVWLRWIAEGRSLEHVLEHLSESAFDTEGVPPLVIPESARRAHGGVGEG